MDPSNQQTTDSKYIQQHLANERTYLAWVRTSITIMGVGFLVTNLHFTFLTANIIIGDLLAKMIGLSSIIIGMIVLIITTIGYFRKGRDINNQTYTFSKGMIMFLTITIILIFIIFGCYYLVVWNLI